MAQRPGDVAQAAGELRITVLSVGAGQCVVVEPPGDEVYLIDAGSSSLADPLHSCLAPFLRHIGKRRVGAIFLSHGDFDHIGAAAELVTGYEARDVFTSPHFRRHAPESAPCEALLDLLDKAGRGPRLIVRGDRVALPGGAVIDVLWPPADCDFNSNDTGLVLRLRFGGRSMLFPADIQSAAQRELLAAPGGLKSDILLAPHHGSGELTTTDFVRAVSPTVILSSNARSLTNKQRDFETMIGGRPLLRTSRWGAITVTIRADGSLRVTPFVDGAGLPTAKQGVTIAAPRASR